MGYTHYFDFKAKPPKDVWEDFIKAKDAILKQHAESGGFPIEDLSDLYTVDINGVGDDAFENLVLHPDPGWSFCKTGQRPYDVVVVAVLCALATICKDYVLVTSDGDREDWLEGQKLACDALGQVEIPSTI